MRDPLVVDRRLSATDTIPCQRQAVLTSV